MVAMLRYATLYADELARLCFPDERMVDVLSVSYAGGLERTVIEDHGVTSDIFGLHVPGAERAVQRWILGETLDSRRGTHARTLATAAAGDPFLALTDKRLLIIEGLQTNAPRVTWSTLLPEVLQLRSDPHLMVGFGRLRIDFADGSVVRLRSGLLLPFAAIRFSRSFTRTIRR